MTQSPFSTTKHEMFTLDVVAYITITTYQQMATNDDIHNRL